MRSTFLMTAVKLKTYEGAGLQNLEIELIRYLITLFYNYPKFLDQIIIYQMAWFLSATFKVVKKLLPPEASDMMKFASKDNILKDFVSPDQALTSWGGTNNYEFKFVPEKKNNKKVSFSSTVDRQVSSNSTNSTISTMSENSTNFTNNTEDELISVEPSDIIKFAYENEETIGRIKISNLEDKPLAFKIRTTGPEKFWVRPCSGIIPAKKTEQITITILPGYEKTAMREKFSIMATPSNDQTNLSEVWRTALNSDIEERRLKCNIDTNQVNNIATNNAMVQPNFAKSLEDLKSDVKDLKTQCQIKVCRSVIK
ncbi:MSP (Major sperm protein) domain-containing protein [Phthorimaea operculella]|nr:MSP (Major sperm protein) domain-containing protein [Phthorimaea operculella]